MYERFTNEVVSPISLSLKELMSNPIEKFLSGNAIDQKANLLSIPILSFTRNELYRIPTLFN